MIGVDLRVRSVAAARGSDFDPAVSLRSIGIDPVDLA